MAIIGNQTQSQTVAISAAKQQIDSSINQLFAQMRAVYLTNYNLVWNSPDYAPSDLLALYAGNGIELFRLSALLRDTIQSAVPSTLPTETLTAPITFTVAFNQDGSVTITDATSSSSSGS